MKYLLITNDFYPNNIGGMTNYYTGIAGAFGHESMYVLTVAAENDSSRTIGCNVFRSEVRGKNSGGFLAKKTMYREASKIIEENNIDVVLCGNVRPYADIAYKLFKAKQLPYYIFFHGNDLLRILNRMKKNLFKRMSYGHILKKCSGFITNSNYVMTIIPSNYKENKSLIIAHPGINSDYESLELSPPLAKPDNKIKLLSVGRLDKRKGVETVLYAIEILKKRGQVIHYDVVGAGNKAYYESIAQDLGISDCVTFHGFRSSDEVKEFFKQCDVLIMVSYASDKEMEVEGFGIVYLEANAYGKPVIGSITGGIPDAVEDKKTGFLVNDPLNPEEVADKIKYFCDNPDAANEMGTYGYHRVNEEFTYRKIAEKLKKELE